MSLLTAAVVGVLFGAGIHLMTRDDLVKLTAGTLLIGNAAVLLLVSAGFRTLVAPPPDAPTAAPVADPLVQALALTAVVINFATTVLLLRVMLAVESTHDTLDTEQLVESEMADEARAEDEAGEPT